MRVSIVVFPGSNCEQDAKLAYEVKYGAAVNYVWHQDRDLANPDLVILPGGFSYGDYLRCGAMAKLSPAMEEVAAFAKQGGSVLGICNGFQILCELELLPGALMANRGMRFISQFVNVKVNNTKTPFTKDLELDQVIAMPIAHMEGNYFVDNDTLKAMQDNTQIVYRYCGPKGEIDPKNTEWNPNGAIDSIAGVCSSNGRVVGLMPHPERCVHDHVSNGFSTEALEILG